ncbi:hypothetical protein [Methylobacterium nonmethylotrophicum]|uniref:Uncharacterized protein n=1 Tax=Methylobacterium nonmethylotrophicum TaxID=1141884 RepID=A0A4Z0NVF0_9HYPH|nr:hypothetical protein [Methylobacterium nonmethylotrophicum]TGE01301.1 hypothetical protein EU555_06825 [Methylobacterium nonmethylotrophicum]
MRAHSLLILSVTLAAPLPALAQNQVPISRSERTVEGINRSIESNSEIRGIQQQNRFENNQIRGDIQRQQSMPQPPVVVPRR